MSFSVNATCPQQEGSENYEQWGIILERATGSKRASDEMYAPVCCTIIHDVCLFTSRSSKESCIFLPFHELTKTQIKR